MYPTRVEITPGYRRNRSCIPQKQPPARTARSFDDAIALLVLLRLESIEVLSLTIPPLPPGRRFLPDLRDSAGRFLLLTPFEQGSVHRRPWPRRHVATLLSSWCNPRTWFAPWKNLKTQPLPLS